jgi:peptidoglycan biosynthesis protein MviN/MurJ (putative lipid II flippase)
MLRELHQSLTELQASVAPLASAAQAGVRLSTLTLTLPLDMVVVLKGGACVLLGDLPRNSADAHWHEASTRLHLTLEALPVLEADA